MRALRLATIAASLLIVSTHAPLASAQILDTGVGRCIPCGHSERDTQRYVNSFLNQMFFPNSVLRRSTVVGSLYLFNGIYTMHGNRSPNEDFSSVTISVTAELKGALPTGNYRLVVTTPGGKTSTKTYAIGETRFVVRGRLDGEKDEDLEVDSATGTGAGGGGRSGPPSSGGSHILGGSRGPAKCSRSRREDRRNETITWCSQT